MEYISFARLTGGDEDEFDDKIRACNGVEFVRKTWIF